MADIFIHFPACNSTALPCIVSYDNIMHRKHISVHMMYKYYLVTYHQNDIGFINTLADYYFQTSDKITHFKVDSH